MECILEVCVDNIESARKAEAGGADRIELCQALAVGGLTPSLGFLRKIKENLNIPVFTMIRARDGDFSYSELEVEQMKDDIRAALSVGINGFVLGALRKNNVDKEVCYSLLTFDLIEDSSVALSDIIELGFSRILTSGHSTSAYKGMENIKSFIEKVESRIIIMPGCGINVMNLKEIKDFTGATEYHSSAQLPRAVVEDNNVVKGTTYHPMTSIEIVKKMKTILCSYS
ncbi:copper homeostasis protein cutC homolog isoform X2 [Parasteatoda tepidariorum]|uniref:copper homeostasis protein cutC homolog isoform X2 n=1 Tax=Parasteatoda tepidariorum TaxID=114398 RepID=UPI00077F8453|nr:copper homeostasis protein cutC homolog isoform X2 [Parasteatoda tepidariorum]XP_015915943.1 copper homeostasis protein cutC homolog isoform X2 [Parasteatoda tepidariorum]